MFVESVFILCFVMLTYIYIGYPVLIWLLPKSGLSVSDSSDSMLPMVSLIIAAYNEATVIEDKLKNSLALDYPKDKLEIWVASDGSNDGTDEIVKRYLQYGIKVNRMEERGGKTKALNNTVPKTNGEIVLFSDANTMYKADSLRKLVRHFTHQEVGGVTGDVRILNKKISFGNSENLYYKYEHFIQFMEGRLYSIVGVDGAMYAIRKKLFIPPSDNIILDDFVISISVVKQGYRLLFDPEAIATENATPNSAQEYRRKVRISAGAIQTIKQREGVPGFSQTIFLFCYVSHKLLRWLGPFFLIGLYLANIAILNGNNFYTVFLLSGQTLFYLAGMFGWYLDGKYNLPLAVNIAHFFLLENYACFIGVIKGLMDKQKVTWKKADRITR